MMCRWPAPILADVSDAQKIEAFMTILLISWTCASIALCLAFLSVAARQAPRMDEQMAAGCDPVLRRETAVALGNAKTAYPPSWSELPSPTLHAKTEEFLHAQPDDPRLSLASVAVFHPGMERICLSPRCYGANPEEQRGERAECGMW